MDKKQKLIIKYIFIYLASSICFIYFLNIEKQEKIDLHMADLNKQTLSNYEALYNKYKNLSSVIFNTRINTQKVIDIYKDAYTSNKIEKNILREKLLKQLSSTYDLLKEFNLKQLHFHLPNNESFLRFHRPSKYGDNLTGFRSTVEYVNKTKKPIDGFEEGRIFNGYRFVFPLFDKSNNNKHIGSVEISFSSLAFHTEYMQDYHIASNFLVLKELVDKKVFKSEKANYIQSPIKSFYIEKNIYDSLNKNLKIKDLFLIHNDLANIEKRVLKGETFSYYDKYNNVIKTFLPIINPITKKVSALYVSIEKGGYISEKSKDFYTFCFAVLLFLGVIFYFIYKNGLSSLSQEELIERLSSKAKELKEYKRVLDESDIVSKADLRGNITYVNKRFTDITGYTKEELIGRPHNLIRDPDVPKKLFKTMWNTIQNKQTFKGIVKNRRKDGTSYYVDATIVPILDVEGQIKEYIGLRHDITDIMNPKKQFIEHLNSCNEPLAIMIKMQNYTLLKEFFGEVYIQVVEEYLSLHIMDFLPKNSTIEKVYPLDNGEFGFVREKDGIDILEIKKCLKQFQNNISNYKFLIDDNKIDIDVYIAFTTQINEAFENLKIGINKAENKNIKLICADDLYFESKKKAQSNMEIVNLLKNAVNNKSGKLVSYFQAIVNNKTGEIEKYESLARLIDKDSKVISPYFFIDVAKKASLYSQVTEVLLDNSFKLLDKIDVNITINLSTMDIENKQTRQKLLDLVKKPNYMGRVTYELLEDEETNDFDLVKEFIEVSKKEGKVKIAIDDFGSGYSNFERLLDFQPDILKIDGSLIKNIVQDEFSRHVVEAIVLFAKKQNIKTVAEFVSDEKIYEKVKSLGIDYSQGFYLGKPKPL